MSEIPPPSAARRHLASELAMLAMVALWLVPFVYTTYFNQDEFNILYDAVRQMHGQVVYRDFFEFYAPLVTWLPAWLFKVVGPSLQAARLLQAAFLGVASWQLYHLARRLACGPWVSTLPGLALVVALYRLWPGYSHHWVVLVFLFGALQAALRGLESPRLAWWALAGGFGALDLLCMQSDGLALLAWLALLPLLDAWLGDRKPLAALQEGLAVLAGALLPLVPTMVYLASQHALRAAYWNVWAWPLSHYKIPGNINDIPWGTYLPKAIATNTSHWVNLPSWYATLYHFLFLYALLPLAAAIALCWGLGLCYRRVSAGLRWTPQERAMLLVSLLSGLLFLVMTRGSGDTVHTAQYAILPLLLAVAIAERFAAKLAAPSLVLVKRLPTLAILAFILTGAWQFANDARRHPDLWLSFKSPDARLAQSPIFQYLVSHTDAHDTIAAMPFGGLYNFYTRPAATRYTLMGPLAEHYYTRAEVLDFEHEILARRPKFVVIDFPYRTYSDPGQYLPEPLPGYHLKASLPDADTQNPFKASLFERDGAR